ncbi:MAG: hypothetical protein ACJATT_000378 [Myxococcota bacterium]|jgi:hypothetical protein
MNLSKRSLVFALMILPFAVGCPKDEVVDSGEGTEGTEGTRAPDYYEPTGFFVDGIFGYDSVAGQIGPFTNPDSEDQIPTQVLITLQDSGGDTCEVLITSLTVLAAPAWITTVNDAGTDTVYTGFTLDDAVTVQSNCTDYDFDPDVFGTADELIDRIAAFTWGLGVSQISDTTDLPIATDLEEAVVSGADQATWDDEFAPYVLGGGFFVQQGAEDPGQFVNFNWAQGFGMDENNKLTYVDADSSGTFNPSDSGEGDALVQILTTDLEDGTVPTGVYQVRAFFGVGIDGIFTL